MVEQLKRTFKKMAIYILLLFLVQHTVWTIELKNGHLVNWIGYNKMSKYPSPRQICVKSVDTLNHPELVIFLKVSPSAAPFSIKICKCSY